MIASHAAESGDRETVEAFGVEPGLGGVESVVREVEAAGVRAVVVEKSIEFYAREIIAEWVEV